VPGLLRADGEFLPCPSYQANAVRFQRFHLLPDDKFRLGPITIPADGAKSIRATWKAVGPGGFQTFRGESPTQSLLLESR